MQLSRLANGSMRDALSLLDQLISVGAQPLTLAMLEQLLGRPGAEHLAAIVKSIGSADPAATLISIETLIMMGQTPLQVAEYLIEMFRDVMVLKTVGVSSDILLLSGISKPILSELAGGYEVPWLVYAITALERLRYTLKNSETARALLEATLLRLAMSEHFISLDAIAGQLRGGAASLPTASIDVKKKPIAFTNNPAPAAKPAFTPPVTDSPVLSGSITTDSIRSIWPQLLERLQAQNGQLASFLTQARPGEYRNGSLTLFFNDGGQGQLAVDCCKKKNDLIESVLKQTVGQNVAIKYELTKKDIAAPVSANEKAAPVAASPAPPGARINRQQQDEVLSDPAVKMVLLGLSARPTQIERIENEENERQDTEEQV
jgi:DNA polymerase-3 subunit gamma/tau